MSHSFQNKLQYDAESSDTSINKAVLTLASYTRTVYYKYNRIPVFHHLPFAFMETNSKWVCFNILFVHLPLIVFFLFICLYISGDMFKIILPLVFALTLSNSYYI